MTAESAILGWQKATAKAKSRRRQPPDPRQWGGPRLASAVSLSASMSLLAANALYAFFMPGFASTGTLTYSLFAAYRAGQNLWQTHQAACGEDDNNLLTPRQSMRNSFNALSHACFAGALMAFSFPESAAPATPALQDLREGGGMIAVIGVACRYLGRQRPDGPK